MQIHAHSSCEVAAASETAPQNQFVNLILLLFSDLSISFTLFSLCHTYVDMCIFLIMFVCVAMFRASFIRISVIVCFWFLI